MNCSFVAHICFNAPGKCVRCRVLVLPPSGTSNYKPTDGQIPQLDKSKKKSSNSKPRSLITRNASARTLPYVWSPLTGSVSRVSDRLSSGKQGLVIYIAAMQRVRQRPWDHTWFNWKRYRSRNSPDTLRPIVFFFRR